MTMRSLASYLFSLGLMAGVAACNSSEPKPAPTTPPAPDSNTLCGRQRDNDQRCNPTRSACLRQAAYLKCIATEPLYRPELADSYLKCYPLDLGCNSAAQSAALMCAQTAADQIPVGAALMAMVSSACQRCPGVANDQVTDAATCITNLTTNANNLALSLRYYNDDTLNRLNTCIVNSSPPADGCIAFESCYKNILPPDPASPCSGDGGA